MKKQIFKLFMVLGIVTVLTSCKDEVPTPSTPVVVTPKALSPEVISIDYMVIDENTLTITVKTIDMDSLRVHYGFDLDGTEDKMIYSKSRDTLITQITLDRSKAGSRANTDYLNVWVSNIENGEPVEYRNHSFDRVFIDWESITKFSFGSHPNCPTVNGGKLYFSWNNPGINDVILKFTGKSGSLTRERLVTFVAGGQKSNDSIHLFGFNPETKVEISIVNENTGLPLESFDLTTTRIHFYDYSLVGPGTIVQNKNDQSIGSIKIDADGNTVCDKIVVTLIDSFGGGDVAFTPWKYFFNFSIGNNLVYARDQSNWIKNGDQYSVTIPLQNISIGKEFRNIDLKSTTQSTFPQSEKVSMQVILYYQGTKTLETNQVLVNL